MADDEQINDEVIDTTVSEMWSLAKPPIPALDEDATPEQKKALLAAAGGPKVGKLIKYLNDIEDQEELEAKIQERDPATQQSLLTWATLTGKFVVVEWLIKKAKRNAFAFTNNAKEMTVFDKWIEIRKEVEDREREKANAPPEEEEEGEEGEEKQPDPTADQLVFEALSEFHEEWADRAQAIVKSIGELGVYQGHRDEQGTKCGLGQSLFPSGDMYTGEYADNQRHGTGTYYWGQHGMLYSGHWQRNLRHGVGRMVFADGGRYFGAWANDKIHGIGRYTYPDGSTYNGAWQKGIKHGEGTYTFVDGSRYVGCFVDGEFVSGEWHLGASGTRYVGRFKGGKPSGRGVFVFKAKEGGTYRQEGEYVDQKWIPGPVSSKGALPTIDVVVQRKPITIGFTTECAALTVEDLVSVVNFAPFREWLDGVETNTSYFVNEIQIAAVRFNAARAIAEVTLKLVTVDGSGRRVKGGDWVVLKQPSTYVFVLLTDGDRTVAIVEQTANASSQAAEQLRLPQITYGAQGAITGAFVDVTTSALRVQIAPSTTMRLPIDISADPSRTNAQHNILAYVQHVHADTITTAQARLDEAQKKAIATGAASSFVKLRAVRLADVGTMSTDATTIVAANYLLNLAQSGRLPAATAEAQRPPTPIPPAIEHRPDIEPLLAAELAKKKKATDDADE